MAILSPKIETIQKLNPPPTEGEMACIKFLTSSLPDDYEIYFQPQINGDNPDIVLMRKGSGVLIIEVKDWALEHYRVDEKGSWFLKSNDSLLKSPLEQVKTYKHNLYSLHIPGLLEKKIMDKKIFALISTVVYFHKESTSSVGSFVKNKDRYVDLLGYDSLDAEEFNKILHKRYLSRKSSFFTEELYYKFKRFLQPPYHFIEKGKETKYTLKQQELFISKKDKQQKIKGVAGSGKTLVLARRAVDAYKKTEKRVLILTYNITLKNYIHDKISEVREDFSWDNFYIDNYHNFLNSQANNLSIDIQYNENNNESHSDYEDLGLFENCKDKIIKYDSIFIDEIQDYKTEWIKIVKKYFLSKNGEFVVFGDEKQNIYNRKMDLEHKPNTTIPGRWAELNESFRFSNKIAKIALRFQKEFFMQKYDLDNIKIVKQDSMFSDENIEYLRFSNKPADELINNIWEILKNKNIHSNDICILSSKIALLRSLDFEIRKRKREKTKTTFETKEVFEKLKEESSDLKLELKLKEVRKNKKFNFWMNPGTSKLSTIHSFKGWEIPTLFLVIDSKENSDELIYTAITRCRFNLFIIDLGNPKYKEFFEANSDIIKIHNPK